jgi:hypothetical protein
MSRGIGSSPDFPAEHWLHLGAGNVIESPFARVRLRQRVTKSAGSGQKGLLMTFQILTMAEQRRRKLNGALQASSAICYRPADCIVQRAALAAWPIRLREE